MVELLLAKTNSGVLRWEVTPFSDQFVTGLSDVAIRVGRSDGVFEIDPFVSIYNGEGDLLESFTDEGLKASAGHDIRELERLRRPIVSELFDSAKRSALGTDKILDRIIDELE